MERISHIFEYMEWDNLTDRELDLIESFERQYIRTKKLSERQTEILEDIFIKAAER